MTFRTPGLVFLAAISCRADLTVRYKTELKFSDSVPATLLGPMKQQLAAMAPTERMFRIKGDKTLTEVGALVAILDNSGGTITLLNPATKQFSRVTLDEYTSAVQKSIVVPPSALSILKGLSVDVKNSRTGQTGMVAGIRADENLTTLAMSMNMNGGAPIPMARVEIHTWVASPDDLNRVQGLREYANSVQRALNVFNSTDQMQKMFAQLPGFGDKMGAAMAELTKNTGNLTVKMQSQVYVPMMALLAPQTRAGAAPVDPNAPLMDLRMDIADISTANIDPSAFDVPSDYQAIPVSDILKALLPVPATVPKAALNPAGVSVGAPAMQLAA